MEWTSLSPGTLRWLIHPQRLVHPCDSQHRASWCLSRALVQHLISNHLWDLSSNMTTPSTCQHLSGCSWHPFFWSQRHHPPHIYTWRFGAFFDSSISLSCPTFCWWPNSTDLSFKTFSHLSSFPLFTSPHHLIPELLISQIPLTLQSFLVYLVLHFRSYSS